MRAPSSGIPLVSGLLTISAGRNQTAGVGIRVLGPVRVDGDDSLRPRDRRVLAALAVRHGEALTAAAVADAVWAGEPPASWAKQVQICVARLRKALGAGAIETVSGGYRLVTTVVDLDIVDVERLVARGQALMKVGEADRAAATFDRAATAWRGTAFDDLDGWPPAQAERARLEELRGSLAEDLLEARLMSGEHRAVAPRAEALVAEEPLRERRWALLARAQYRCGRQAQALRSLQTARRLLVEQFGIDPSRELVDLETAILRQDSALLAIAEQRPISDECPYKGLASYDLGDRLFGRDAEVAAILDRLRTSRFLVLAGPSGCGKSSLLRAGVVPALQRLGRSTMVIVPGSDGRLPVPDEVATLDRGHAPVLVVDQLEELFAVGHPAETIRDACARLVTYSHDVGPVVAAVRADHLVSLGSDESLGRLIEQGLHLISPLTGDSLREAIERPAAEAGLRIEDGFGRTRQRIGRPRRPRPRHATRLCRELIQRGLAGSAVVRGSPGQIGGA